MLKLIFLDENNESLSSSLITLPSKRKVPEYYQRITEPIDLTTVDQNITKGMYKSPEVFDSDICRVFNNCVKYYGRTSEPGIAATRLKKIYSEAKKNNLAKFEEVVGEKLPPGFISNKRKGNFAHYYVEALLT